MDKSIEEIAKLATEWWIDNSNDCDLDKDSVNRFTDRLASMIIEKIANEENISLDVDYEPCSDLSRAMDYAGIFLDILPQKTVMWISKNHVSVKLGYGNAETLLYSNDAYIVTIC